jgi:hypothetical protein
MVNPPLGKRRGAEKGGCPLYVDPILLKSNDTPRWRKYFIDNK